MSIRTIAGAALISAILPTQLQASNDYLFAASTADYVPLSGATLLVQDALIATGTYSTVGVGFPFQYWGVLYTTFTFGNSGYCYPGNLTAYGFYPFLSQLTGLGDSQIRYALDNSGGVGQRILKVEWWHVGFLTDPTHTDHASFQVWLRESSNTIEFHYGPSGIATTHYTSLFGNASGPQVALSDPAFTSFYNLQGAASSPTAIYQPNMLTYITGYPQEGAVYAFSPAAQAGITGPSITPDELSIFPRPAIDHVTIQWRGHASTTARFALLNAAGEQILSGVLTNAPIDLSALPTGLFFVRVEAGGRTWNEQLLHLRP